EDRQRDQRRTIQFRDWRAGRGLDCVSGASSCVFRTQEAAASNAAVDDGLLDIGAPLADCLLARLRRIARRPIFPDAISRLDHSILHAVMARRSGLSIGCSVVDAVR